MSYAKQLKNTIQEEKALVRLVCRWKRPNRVSRCAAAGSSMPGSSQRRTGKIISQSVHMAALQIYGNRNNGGSRDLDRDSAKHPRNSGQHGLAVHDGPSARPRFRNLDFQENSSAVELSELLGDNPIIGASIPKIERGLSHSPGRRGRLRAP